MAHIDWLVPGQLTAALLLWVHALTSAQPECSKGTFRNSVTGSCLPCSSICEDAEAKKTVDQCAFFCHDYSNRQVAQGNSSYPTSPCHVGSYFDAALNKCGSCTTLCSTGQGPDCQQKCGPDFGVQPEKKHLSAGMIVLIVFIVLCLVIMLVLGVMHLLRPGRLSWRTSNPYRRPQTSPEEADDPHSIFSSHDDLEPLEEEQKNPNMVFSDLNLTLQNNPLT